MAGSSRRRAVSPKTNKNRFEQDLFLLRCVFAAWLRAECEKPGELGALARALHANIFAPGQLRRSDPAHWRRISANWRNVDVDLLLATWEE